MNTALTIAKFGGTSVADYAAMRACAKIIQQSADTRVVVVSASAGVTNHLVSLCHDVLDDQQIDEILAQITKIQHNIHECLPESAQRDGILQADRKSVV